ncbi:MAG: hypothetical protein R6U98_17795 [Pirellulaceae bacterium]
MAQPQLVTFADAGFDLIPESEWGDYDDNNGVRHLSDHFQMDQDGVGSCASESAVGCLMVVRQMQGLEQIKFNPWSLYQQVTSWDNGSSLSDNIRKISEVGVLSMETFPRTRWNADPPRGWHDEAKRYRLSEWWQITSLEEFVTALILRFPVYYGRSGHAIFAVENVFNRRGVIYKNSWSADWGDEGYGFDSYRSFQRQIGNYGAYVPRVAIVPTEGGDDGGSAA